MSTRTYVLDPPPLRSENSVQSQNGGTEGESFKLSADRGEFSCSSANIFPWHNDGIMDDAQAWWCGSGGSRAGTFGG